MTNITDQQFADEVAALEKELQEGVAAINAELQSLHAELDANLAAADKVFTELAAEIAREDDFTESTES